MIATTPTIGSGDNVWNDRKEVEEGGNITAINIKTRFDGYGTRSHDEALFCIGSIRTR